MLDRREFLRGLMALPIIGFTNVKLNTPKAIAKVVVKFNNGDVLEIGIGEDPDKPGQFMCISNSLNHHDCILTTSFDIPENFFKLGELYQAPVMGKPIIEYRGYNKFGRLVYEGVADNKTWIDLTV